MATFARERHLQHHVQRHEAQQGSQCEGISAENSHRQWRPSICAHLASTPHRCVFEVRIFVKSVAARSSD